MAKFYLTTPIYYVNDVPHLGHAYSTINADAITRWHRLIGDDVYFLTGTDEHGLKVKRAAEANNRTPLEQADFTSQRFKETWEQLNVANDIFFRTTEKRHHIAVRKMLQKCYDNGFIYKGVYDGLYSVADESYVSQEDVDSGKVGGQVEVMKEENYFFKLSEFTQSLLDWYESAPDNVVPEGYRNEALGIIKGGLEDVSITRTSLDWGVRVPWDENHVFYVWYDALINYASALGYGDDEKRFLDWWPATHHLIGKDILRFHCVYWPAMLIAAGIKDLPKVRVHGWLLVGGEKMSKSKLNQIQPSSLTSDFGVDGFRYLLLRDNPFGPDSDISYEAMVGRYNSDLANGLGNLLGRICQLIESKCGGKAPKPNKESPLALVVQGVVDEAGSAWENFQASKALEATWKIIREADELLTREKPWEKDSGPDVDLVLGDALEALRITTILASPAVPSAALEILSRLGYLQPEEMLDISKAKWGSKASSQSLIQKTTPLFMRIKKPEQPQK